MASRFFNGLVPGGWGLGAGAWGLRRKAFSAFLVIFSLVSVAAQQNDRARTEAMARRAGERLQALQREADRLASEERTRVDLVALVDGIHHPLIRVRVGHRQQPRREIVFHLLRLRAR